MTKRTIALISAFPPGQQSLNEYGYHLAINFAADETVEKLIVIADELDEDLEELDLGEKIEVRRVWRFNSPFAALKISRALRQVKPDLAIYNIQTASFGDREIPSALGLCTPLLTRWLGVRSGVIAHNMVSGIDLEGTVLQGQKLRQMIVKSGAKVVDWALLNANYITFTTEAYTDQYKSRFPKSDVNHVPHGTFDTRTNGLTPYKDRKNTIVTMGKFGTYKRLETLISAMDTLQADGAFKDLHLVIGGSDHPNTPGYLAALEAEHGHKDYMTFHGYIAEEDIPEFFGQARVSVFDYSATTGSSGVLHQTVSYDAVPVFPAIGDFVDVCAAEGLVGENYEPNDPQDMARAIEAVLSDETAAIEMAKKNRQAAESLPMSEIIAFHLSKID